eukprot:NODE_959_length_1092_cov_225.067358_g915_i0.p1 GENE.NODE_959_length_1092_cov_225.067358_g915_i0~~NODE_959_length_1092_cov_225.067358_g915_i0.p1  ORF type:complete len:201 (-),score=39.19 NODE_959_length_1092_cov_225.067358_g915_i0:303-905(-)
MPCYQPTDMSGNAADWTQQGVNSHNPYDVPCAPSNQYYNYNYYTPCQEACCVPYQCQDPCCAPYQCQEACCVPQKCAPECYTAPCCYDQQPSTSELLVHDPYSFAAYSTLNANAQPEDEEKKTIQEPVAAEPVQAPVCEQIQPLEIMDDAEAVKRAIQEARRARVTPPCGHDNFKRLRFKKGLSHYLCLTCSTKWRQAGV